MSVSNTCLAHFNTKPSKNRYVDLNLYRHIFNSERKYWHPSSNSLSLFLGNGCGTVLPLAAFKQQQYIDLSDVSKTRRKQAAVLSQDLKGRTYSAIATESHACGGAHGQLRAKTFYCKRLHILFCGSHRIHVPIGCIQTTLKSSFS